MNCDDEGGKRDRGGAAEASMENEEDELYNQLNVNGSKVSPEDIIHYCANNY